MNATICVVTEAQRRRRASGTAPLARALLGRRPGASIPFQGEEAEILSIEV